MIEQRNCLVYMNSSESLDTCLECGITSSSLIECQHFINSSGISTASKVCKRCVMGATTKNLSRTSSLEKYSVEALNLSHLVCASDEEDECQESISIHLQKVQKSTKISQKKYDIRKHHQRRITPDEIIEERESNSMQPKPINNNSWENAILTYPLPLLKNFNNNNCVSPISFEHSSSSNYRNQSSIENVYPKTSWEDMVIELFDVDKILEDLNDIKEDRNDNIDCLDRSSSTLTFSSPSYLSQRNSIKRRVGDITNESPNKLNDDEHRQKKFRKTVPCVWTNTDDDKLIQVVRSLQNPIKWPEVARSFPNRSGKQCRERYLNHLNPKLVRKEWTTEEDETIFRFYTLFGAQWAKMSNFLQGRTDNNIKNRFHHLRRKLERDVDWVAKKSKRTQPGQNGKGRASSDGTSNAKTACLNSSLDRRLQALVDERIRKRDSTTFQRKVSTVVGHVAAEAIDRRHKSEIQDNESKTSLSSSKEVKNRNKNGTDTSCDADKFRKVDPRDMEQCRRCHLFLPSKQCGTKIHRVTRWCESCSAVPSYISRDSLYDTLWTIGKNEA